MKNILIGLCIMLNAFILEAQITETEPNDSILIANPLPIGTTISGQSCLYDEPDFFRIITPVDGVLKINSSVSAPVPEPPQKFSLTLISKTNNFYSSFSAATGGNGSAIADSVEYCCLAADTFYIEAYRSLAFELCYDYSFKCTVIPASFANDAEPDSYPFHPLFLAYNTSTDGHLGFSNDPYQKLDVDDYYTIVTPSDGVVRVITQTEAQSPGNGAMNVTLLDKANNELYTQYATAGAFQSPHSDTLYWDCISQDTIHIRTGISYATSGGYAYRLHYDVIAPGFGNDQEPNNSYSTARIVNPNTTFDGHLMYYGASDPDYYEFYKSDSGYLKIYSQAETYGVTNNNYYDLSLENKNHCSIITHYPFIGGQSQAIGDSIIIPALAADSFYIIVYQATFGAPCMSYQIQIKTPSYLGITEMGNTHFNIIPNPSNGDFYIETDNKMPNASVKVYNIYGQEVFGENLDLIAQKEIHLNKASPGIYFVEVSDGVFKYIQKMIVQ